MAAVAESPHSQTKSVQQDRLLHAMVLAGAVAVPLFGSVMAISDGERVFFQGIGSIPLPTLCLSRWIGFECPTCGMTRSVIALLAGDLGTSLEFHRYGWLIFLQIIGQIPYRAYRLYDPHRPRPLLERFGATLLMLTVGLVLMNWVYQFVIS